MKKIVCLVALGLTLTTVAVAPVATAHTCIIFSSHWGPGSCDDPCPLGNTGDHVHVGTGATLFRPCVSHPNSEASESQSPIWGTDDGSESDCTDVLCVVLFVIPCQVARAFQPSPTPGSVVCSVTDIFR